jgi:hypothetical protein
MRWADRSPKDGMSRPPSVTRRAVARWKAVLPCRCRPYIDATKKAEQQLTGRRTRPWLLCPQHGSAGHESCCRHAWAVLAHAAACSPWRCVSHWWPLRHSPSGVRCNATELIQRAPTAGAHFCGCRKGYVQSAKPWWQMPNVLPAGWHA